MACGIGLLLAGCREQPTLLEMTEALTQRNIGHCLYIQGAAPPYVTGYLYVQSGIDCDKIWNWRRMQEVP